MQCSQRETPPHTLEAYNDVLQTTDNAITSEYYIARQNYA